MADVRELPDSKAGGLLERPHSPGRFWTDVSENNCLHYFLIENFVPGFLFFLILWKQLVYKMVIISAVQQSNSVIHVQTSILFQILFSDR